MADFGKNAKKELTLATPTTRIADDVVLSWEVEVRFSYENYAKRYQKTFDVAYQGKIATEFTKAELLSFCDLDHMALVFDSQYVSTVTPSVDRRQDPIDLSTLV